MTVHELVESNIFKTINYSTPKYTIISEVFCCDLLSIAMGKAPADGAWVTVMGNINTLAVARLTDVACIILAEGAMLDDVAKSKSIQEDITVLSTELAVFEAALAIHNKL